MHARNQRAMANKVAQKYLSQGLRDQMQASLSQARVQASVLEEMVERGQKLIEASEHREHIYREAGDMITRFQTSLTELNRHLATVSYVVNQMAVSSAGQDLNPALRKDLDRLMEASAKITDPSTLQGIPTHLEDVPPAIERKKQDQESIYDVDRADDLSKRAPEPNQDVIDYSNFSTYISKPDVSQDSVP